MENLTNFGTKCIEILNDWGSPYAIFEHNGIGMSFCERLMNGDLDYENFYVHENGKVGVMSGPVMKIKMVNCLKKYMEKDILKINDSDTINEMMSYIEKQSTSGNKKFEADTGNDDLTVTCGWTAFLLDTVWIQDVLSYQ